MKKLLMIVCLLSAGLITSCTKTSTETTDSANQTAASTPAATATPTPAPVAGTNADDEMYKAVEDQECRMYLASIKVVSDCK